MGWLWIGLLGLALAVLVLAEWPRLVAGLPLDRRDERRRRRRRADLHVVTPPADDSDDFAASVERDLAQLPTTQERDRNR
ncbi:MAG: hypothetical protein ICV59_04430 [Thermoleophilia bacterium]|nr:hypothetical protein [Thermoleophilia bacterium]